MLRSLFLVVGIFILGNAGYCQSSDLIFWNGFALDYKIADPLTVSLKNQLRLNNNISQLKTAFSNLSFTYKVSSPLRVTAGYRFSLTIKENRHRLYGGFAYRHKVKSIRTTFQGRLRFQGTIVGNERPKEPEYFLRPKLLAKYDVKGAPVSLIAGAGTWYGFARAGYRFDRYRLQMGLDYELSKRNTLSFAYQYQHEFNTTDPLYSHILLVEIGVDITQKKKGKKKGKEEKEEKEGKE